MSRSLNQARSDALRLLKVYLRSSIEERTPLLRSLAEAIVDAREHFARPDGKPDWKGRSYPYRTWVRDLFAEAGVHKDDQATVQAAIRYHIGTVLRERLTDDELAEYDLIAKSPKERSADRRSSKSALLSALTQKEIHGGALYAITAAVTVLGNVAPEALDSLDPGSAELANASLVEIERKAKQLRKRLAANV